MTMKALFNISVVLCLLSLGACKKYDEVPKLPENNQYNRVYRIKEPRVATAEELDEAKKIKQEYDANTR